MLDNLIIVPHGRLALLERMLLQSVVEGVVQHRLAVDLHPGISLWPHVYFIVGLRIPRQISCFIVAPELHTLKVGHLAPRTLLRTSGLLRLRGDYLLVLFLESVEGVVVRGGEGGEVLHGVY